MSAKKKQAKKQLQQSFTASSSQSSLQSTDDDTDLDSQFSPIPAFRLAPTRGNLTGSARKIKDGCADWYNHTEKWKVLVAQGAGHVTEIANVKIASFEAREGEESESATALTDEQREKLESLCQSLETVYLSLEKLVQKMRRITESFCGLCELHKYSPNDSETDEPLFQSWSLEQFADTSKELLSMFEKELPVKKCILENCAHATSRDLCMLYITMWVHDPYIPTRHRFLVECMAKETGLR